MESCLGYYLEYCGVAREQMKTRPPLPHEVTTCRAKEVEYHDVIVLYPLDPAKASAQGFVSSFAFVNSNMRYQVGGFELNVCTETADRMFLHT